MTAAEFGQWYYLIYLAPGGAALLTLLLSAIGGGRHHRAAHRAHAGHGGHRASTHHQPGHRHGARASGGRTGAAAKNVLAAAGEHFLAFFGFGRIPAAFVWGSLLLGWSIVGYWATVALQQKLHSPALFVLPSMAAAALGAIAGARVASVGLGRVIPSEESLAVSTVELCGLTGRVAYPVDIHRGRVLVYDVHGTMHDCQARTSTPGVSIARGKTVLVVDYDSANDLLVVEETV